MAGFGLPFIFVGLLGALIGLGCLFSRELRRLAAYWLMIPAATAWGAFIGFDRAPRVTVNEWHVGKVVARDPGLSSMVLSMLFYAFVCAILGAGCAYVINQTARMISTSIDLPANR